MKQLVTIFCLFFLNSSIVFGQSKVDSLPLQVNDKTIIETVVFLKNGSVVRGFLSDWKRGETLFLTTERGVVLEFESDNIRRIKQSHYGVQPGLFYNLNNSNKPLYIETVVLFNVSSE